MCVYHFNVEDGVMYHAICEKMVLTTVQQNVKFWNFQILQVLMFCHLKNQVLCKYCTHASTAVISQLYF